MVEPVTILVLITTIASLFTTGIDWFKKRMSAESPSPAPLSIATQSHPPAILPPPINEDIPRIEYESFKEKKESLPSYKSDNYKSSSNSGSTISVVFVIALILGVMGFIIYRKRNKLKENQFNFRHTEKQFESPPSPRTTQTDLNLTIV